MFDFSGKTVVITGGNSGIGLGTAQAFDAAGATVVITGRDQDKLNKAVATLKNGKGFVVDVAKVSDIKDLYKKTGPIDVLFANAGAYMPTPLGQTDEVLFDRQFIPNVKGVFFTVQEAVALLRKGASVILTASIAGHRGYPGSAGYAASKAAVISLAKSFAGELGPDIRVNSISPGYVDTPPIHQWREAQPEVFAQAVSELPARRIGMTDEIAKLVMYLASDAARYVTGSDIIIDGGHICGFPHKP